MVAADPGFQDEFGDAVSLSVDTTVLGAYWDDDLGVDAGSAYIFERNQGGPNNWGQVTKLLPQRGCPDPRGRRSRSCDHARAPCADAGTADSPNSRATNRDVVAHPQRRCAYPHR